MKQCFYEILGVPRDADADGIKKAYRVMALKFHPDKVIGRDPQASVEQATKFFQLITEANEVLSDPHERAWYDSHREQILRGEDTSDPQTSSASDGLWRYFSPSCFKNTFDDAPGSFYRVYANLFDQLASEEEADLPNFGSSRTDWDGVSYFYSNWGGFVSSKEFERFDKWNLNQAENRQVRRLMEQDNRKMRASARKEYSETVRDLVAYVKKRDPRVATFREQKESHDRAAKEKAAQQKVAAVEDKRKARELARIEEELRWREIEALKKGTDAVNSTEEAADSSNESREQPDDHSKIFECLACNKTFKSSNAFQSHEQSKKHKDAVKAIQKELGVYESAKKQTVSNLNSKAPELEREAPVEVVSLQELVPTEEEEESSDDSVVLKTEKNRLKREQAKQILLSAPLIKEKKPRRRKVKEDAKISKSLQTEDDFEFHCLICKKGFISKTAMFKHIRETGHAALK